VTHKTYGHIGNFGALSISYAGSLAAAKWVSLVDQQLGGSYPCSSGAVAAAAADSSHSGPIQAQAGTKLLTIDTTSLDTLLSYAVCYAETQGTAAAEWVDSAIRLTVSKVVSIQYNYGQYLRYFSSTNSPDAKYRLPQKENVAITYNGPLGAGKWISLVDDSRNGGNPCVGGSEAAAPADSLHSGSLQPSGAYSGTKVILIPQTNVKLDAAPTTQFAVCYADQDGTNIDSSWRDSYIRVKMSKLSSITSKKVEHITWGQIDRATNLTLTLSGGLVNNSYTSLVSSHLNNNLPCEAHSAALGADLLHTGTYRAVGQTVIMDTSALDSSPEFGVCYAEVDGSASDTSWKDSGIRLHVSKVNQITYGTPSRSFKSDDVGNDRLLPRANDITFVYTGLLGDSKYFSLVDQTLESNNPCMTVASHPVDANHTGVVVSATTGKSITITTSGLFAHGVYALCYAELTGDVNDTTWRDSYMRIALQKVKSIRSSEVVITTTGTIPLAQKLEISYIGSLETFMYFSLVAENLNNGSSVCLGNIAAATADTKHSGVFRAGFGTKIFYPFTTSSLTESQRFAVCYAETTGDATDSWVDTGFRLRLVKWVNIAQNRMVSGSGTLFSFFLNVGSIVGHRLAILPQDGQTTCSSGAHTAPEISDGQRVKLTIDTNKQVRLPSGSPDTFLTEGEYFMCYCNTNDGSTCLNDNNGYVYIGASFRMIGQPRLGPISNPGNIRAVSGIGHAYFIKGSSSLAYAIADGDKLFFRSDCSVIPSADSASETMQLTVTQFDPVTKAAYLSLPSSSGSPLQSIGSAMRVLRACFTTKQAIPLSGLEADIFVTLTDSLIIAPPPRFGPLADPGDLRAVSASTSTFRIHNFFPGDNFFFASSCNNGVPVPSAEATGLFNASYDSSSESAIFALPAITSLSSRESRKLKGCFAPARSDLTNVINWNEIPDELVVIPDPTQALVTEWKQGTISILDFSGPAGNAGEAGDFVILQKGTCENAHLLTAESPGVAITHSAPMVLEVGGQALYYGIAQGKVNELGSGTYKICFATKSSEYDSMADFQTLQNELTIIEALVVAPQLIVPQSVHLGVDIVVLWNATDSQYSGVSQAGSWLGLYHKGECVEDLEWRHQCYLVARELPTGESGGVVRFSQQDYKAAGEYEVRYFRGNTNDGQGQVCQGLRNTGAGVYMRCTLQAALTSEPINVYGTIESQEDLASVPGLEHVVLV